MSHQEELEHTEGVEIAIIGMAGRFPGAADVEAFWQNLCAGKEAVSFFTDEALQARGVPAALCSDPDYVKAGMILEGADQFDAGFFGYSPREAEYLDPQHRLFLEAAWEALEHAGYEAASWPHPIGVYAGTGANAYLLLNLLSKHGLTNSHDISSLLSLMTGNDKDSLATRVCYKLNLRGPGITVQTACSTSLVAVHLACRGLLNYEADMALAGGVWVNLLQEGGYRYQKGAILSPDGHCRAFDAKAAGTVVGSGVGVVVLKRLADALAEGDTIHGIVKGSAVNNDGSVKVGYTAPSVEGQTEVILAAQAMAEVPADTISYVEAHGTGTTLGDPIEVAALTQAFRASTSKRGFCALGSVKTNVGHLDAAAGVTGLIKAALALKHRTLPPSLHFEQPNPEIDFAASPFYVNSAATDWPAGPTPRRAGVSSFGIGGTNAHVILEEAPLPPPSGPSRPWQILPLSARSPAALEQVIQRLRQRLRQHPELSMADVAYTLQRGRKVFPFRAVALCHSHAEAVSVLESRDPQRFLTREAGSETPQVAFLFPGQGAQHVGMALELYQSESVFRQELDRCIALLKPHLGIDLHDVIYPREQEQAGASIQLEQTALTQPSLFIVEYALARLWMAWGIRPEAMIGHSIGEYVAACLAGVFSLEEALSLVAARGRLLQEMQPGAMIAVTLSEAEVRPCLDKGCDLAAVNGENLCVLSGPQAAIATVEQELAGKGVAVRRLPVSHAFHSALVEPMLAAFIDRLRKIELQPPKIPFVSNLSGRWITPQEATDPEYWGRHLRGTVRFAEGLSSLLEHPGRILLEVGPGETLTTLARRHPGAGPDRLLLSSLPHPSKRSPTPVPLPLSLAQLWLAGVAIDWAGFYAEERRYRIPLPTYPFERQRYWVEPDRPPGGSGAAGEQYGAEALPNGRRNLADGFYTCSWKRVEAMPLDESCASQRGCQVILTDAHSLGAALKRRLQAGGYEVIEVIAGPAFRRHDRQRYTMRPGERDDYGQLLKALLEEVGAIGRIFHLWSVTPEGKAWPFAEIQARGFFSLLYLAQALGNAKAAVFSDAPMELTVVANQVEEVSGYERLCPEKATLLGPCKVIPQEYPQLSCRFLDIELPAPGSLAEGQLADQMIAEAQLHSSGAAIAYRGSHRWLQTFEPIRRDRPAPACLRSGGVYLITGGLGGIGLALARHLARTRQAKLVLLGRSGLPPRDSWAEWLSAPGQAAAMGLRIQQVMALEALGAEVLVLQADVAQESQLRAAIAQARQRFGAIHGVIHAAGEAGGGLIALKTAAMVEQVFAPKVRGTQALQAVLANEALDFMLFCSSMTAILGGFGQIDYCAANLYLDALARASSRQSAFPVLSVNWDTWRGVGMAASQSLPEGLGISAEEGVEAFERVLGGPATPQVIVSALGIETQFALLQTSSLSERLQPSLPRKEQAHARPALKTAYAPPDSELEQGLVEIWQSLLGIDSIGIHDSLFELGGDSLLALQLLSRVRTHYGVELHPADFLKAPTIAGLAMLIEAKLIEEIAQG